MQPAWAQVPNPPGNVFLERAAWSHHVSAGSVPHGRLPVPGQSGQGTPISTSFLLMVEIQPSLYWDTSNFPRISIHISLSEQHIPGATDAQQHKPILG